MRAATCTLTSYYHLVLKDFEALGIIQGGPSMATLERVKLTHEEESVSKSINEALSSTIPSPFPLQQLHRDHGQFTTGESSKDALDTEDPFSDERAAVAAPAEVGLQQANTTVSRIVPNCCHGVQRTCLYRKSCPQ